MKNCAHNPNHAFTLIELSIVLVIIGLIVGGVLVGRDLIHAAEIRMTVAQVEKYKTAVNTFKLKYNCIPGDCANAVGLGLGTAGGPGDNGDGDHVVPGSLTSGISESLNFWYHLSQANLAEGYKGYPGNLTTLNQTSDLVPLVPTTKLGGKIWVSSYFETLENNFFLIDHITGYFSVGDGGVYYGGQTPYENYTIDSKIDDGLPTTGTVQSYAPAPADGFRGFTDPVFYSSYVLPSQGPAGAHSNFCVANDNTPYTYNIINTSHDPSTLCVLQINGDF